MMRISAAGMRLLETIPDDWGLTPPLDGVRFRGPLVRAGYIEIRKTDVTPPDWRISQSGFRLIKQEWRRTDAGRTALQAAKEPSHD